MLNSMDPYIKYHEEVLDTFFCNSVLIFFAENPELKIQTKYGSGENTLSSKIILDKSRGLDEESSRIEGLISSTLLSFIHGTVLAEVYPIANLELEPIQIREMSGPTLKHSDNIDPIYFNQKISYRVVTILANISDSSDVLVFPRQKVRVPITGRSIITFPPYWMYEHYSESVQAGRITITSWARESISK